MTDPDRNRRLEAIFPEHRDWILAVATVMTGPGHPDRDDVAQEGLIALWEAVGDHRPDGAPLGPYVRWRARIRMVDVVRGRYALTGEDRARRHVVQARGTATRERIRAHLRANPYATGRQIADALGLAESTVSRQRRLMGTDGPAPVEVPLVDADDTWPDDTDVLDTIIERYHEGRIAEALDALTPAERRYVHLRFWEGKGTAALTDQFGYQPHALWRTAKRRLADALADLAA